MTGGVKGPIPNSPTTTSEPTTPEEVKKEGKLPLGGPTVQEQEPKTPVKDGSGAKATSNTSLDERSTQQVSPQGVTVEEATNDLKKLEEAVNDNNGDEFIENPAPVPNDVQWVTDDEVTEAQSEAKAAFKPFNAIKSGASRLKRAVFSLVHKLRANPEVGVEMAQAAAKLAEAKVEGGVDVKEATEEVGKMMEESPKAFMAGLEAMGMHEAVSELRETCKVATEKNLAKMKSNLMKPEVLGRMPAVQGMSQEKAEMIINGALIVSKLANPAGGNDASGVEGRGYTFGRVPAVKYDVVEWVLGMEPEMVLKVLSTHPRLKNTTFEADIRGVDRRMGDAVLGPRQFAEGPVTEDGVRPTARDVIASSVEEIFEEGALPMFERAEAEAKLQDNFRAFLEKRKNSVLLERRERAGQRFKDIGMADNISEELVKAGLESLKKTNWTPSSSNNDAARAIQLKEKIEEQTGFNLNDVAAMAQHRTFRNKYKSGDALPSDQAQEIAGVYKDLHSEVRNLMEGLTEAPFEGKHRGITRGEGLMNANDFEENARVLTNAIMVACGYAVFADPKSPDTIIDTFHGAFEHDFDGMTQQQIGEAVFQNKAAMAQRALAFVELLAKEGPDKLADALIQHPAVYETDL